MAAAATTNGIETPQKFLPGAGPPPIPWNEWRPLFENYCDAIDFDDFADKGKKVILFNCLGTVGQKRFSKLPNATYPQGATEYTKALLKLEKEYKLVKNKRAECYLFRKHAQLQGERIHCCASWSRHDMQFRRLSRRCVMRSINREII